MLRDIFAFDEDYYQREIIDSPVCRSLNTCRMQRKYTVSSKRGQNTAPKLETNSQITTYVRYNAYVAAYMLHLLVIFKKTRLAHRKCEKRSKISNSILRSHSTVMKLQARQPETRLCSKSAAT